MKVTTERGAQMGIEIEKYLAIRELSWNLKGHMKKVNSHP
jgi:hypothetical protein